MEGGDSRVRPDDPGAAATRFDTRTDQAPAAMDAIIERHGPESIRIGSLPKDREGRS